MCSFLQASPKFYGLPTLYVPVLSPRKCQPMEGREQYYLHSNTFYYDVKNNRKKGREFLVPPKTGVLVYSKRHASICPWKLVAFRFRMINRALEGERKHKNKSKWIKILFKLASSRVHVSFTLLSSIVFFCSLSCCRLLVLPCRLDLILNKACFVVATRYRFPAWHWRRNGGEDLRESPRSQAGRAVGFCSPGDASAAASVTRRRWKFPLHRAVIDAGVS